jgi:hypothetical protein
MKCHRCFTIESFTRQMISWSEWIIDYYTLFSTDIINSSLNSAVICMWSISRDDVLVKFKHTFDSIMLLYGSFHFDLCSRKIIYWTFDWCLTETVHRNQYSLCSLNNNNIGIDIYVFNRTSMYTSIQVYSWRIHYYELRTVRCNISYMIDWLSFFYRWYANINAVVFQVTLGYRYLWKSLDVSSIWNTN